MVLIFTSELMMCEEPAVFVVQGYIVSHVINFYVLQPWRVNAFNSHYIPRKVVREYITESEWCTNRR
jgi:hypothetical protein